MKQIKIGDIVARKSYSCDLLFKVADVQSGKNGEKNYIIKGIDYRIQADSPETDLKIVSDEEAVYKRKEINKWIEKKNDKNGFGWATRSLKDLGKKSFRSIELFQKPGKILHIDGANDFIDKCREYYNGLGVEVVLVQVSEQEQPLKIGSLLQQHRPDILVLTGHDGMVKGNTELNNIQNYKNSIYYVNAVKEARKYEKSLDTLVIFAGACQSDYEAILEAGANYASSPKRVLIHMFDPAIVAGKVASAGIGTIIPVEEIASGTKTGFEGIGGLETRGKSRTGAPKTSY